MRSIVENRLLRFNRIQNFMPVCSIELVKSSRSCKSFEANLNRKCIAFFLQFFQWHLKNFLVLKIKKFTIISESLVNTQRLWKQNTMTYKLNTVEAEFAKDPKINRDDIKELVDWVPTVDNMPKVTGKVILMEIMKFSFWCILRLFLPFVKKIILVNLGEKNLSLFLHYLWKNFTILMVMRKFKLISKFSKVSLIFMFYCNTRVLSLLIGCYD